MTDQNIYQNIYIALPSGENICVPNQSDTSSGNSSRSRSPSPSRSLAAPHTSASKPVELHKARIESTFQKIEYSTFRGKPACFIVIDVRFIYNKKYMMRRANIQVSFSKDRDDATDDASFPRTTNAFGPIDSFGDVESKPTVKNAGLDVDAGLPGSKVNFGVSTTQTKTQRWQIQGTRPAAKQGDGQSYNWTVFDNDLSSFDSFPRTVTLWMIIEHDNTPFYADMYMEGKLRGHKTTNAVSRFNRYYQDKKEVSKALAPGGLVSDLTFDSNVKAANHIWSCLAAKKGVDGRIFIPTASTSPCFDEKKLCIASSS